MPTNVAFTLLDLSEHTPVAMIGNELLYHIVSEMVELENGKIYETLSRNAVLITVTASEIKINDAAITESISACNGIIYVIDALLLPPPSPTELPTPVPIPPPIEICPELPPEPLEFKSYEEYQDGLSCDFGKITCCGNTGPALSCSCFKWFPVAIATVNTAIHFDKAWPIHSHDNFSLRWDILDSQSIQYLAEIGYKNHCF
jgi:hypothetical protein